MICSACSDSSRLGATFDRNMYYEYDCMNRLTRVRRLDGSPGGSSTFTKVYAFDSVGNRTAMTHTGASETIVETYAYNNGEDLAALTRAFGGSPDQPKDLENHP